jgi:predicted MFS family arabinose efflux permease
MLSYILIAIGVALVTGLFLYLDSRLFDKPKKKAVYFKVILLNVTVVLATIYLLEWLSPTSHVKDVISSTGVPKIMSSSPTVTVPQIGEEMIGGEAPF